MTQLDDMNSSSQSEGDSLDEDTIECMISVEEANRLTVGQRYIVTSLLREWEMYLFSVYVIKYSIGVL